MLIIKQRHVQPKVLKRSQCDIVLPSNQITPQLCHHLIDMNPMMIKYIPSMYHTRDMYKTLYNKNKYVFLQFNMKESLCGDMLHLLIQTIPYYQQSEYNKSKYTVNHYVTEIARASWMLQIVPLDQQEAVLAKLPQSVFTVDTMNHIRNWTIHSALYQHYFCHVPLYRMFNKKTGQRIERFYEDRHGHTHWTALPYDYVVWHPELFLQTIHAHVDNVDVRHVNDMNDMNYKSRITFTNFHCLTME